ncbi:hypothetical protein ACFYYR_26580 [Streptomyces sp. NPDC001922]|uniref:hypothetical protein n=1 Tax=unclassified Streptomyces TaxID=2593676 RepID=UPI0036C7D9F6
MPADDRPQAPIYDSLVQEHGDVLTEARQTMQQVKRETEEALDFSDLRRRNGIPGRTAG